jgi:hypothetical protein
VVKVPISSSLTPPSPSTLAQLPAKPATNNNDTGAQFTMTPRVGSGRLDMLVRIQISMTRSSLDRRANDTELPSPRLPRQ